MAMERFLVVGLGNPGRRYAHTRHNAGFDVVEVLSQMTGIQIKKIRHRAVIGEGKWNDRQLVLAQPQTYMNVSGESVVSLLSWYKPEMSNLIVVYDDVDLLPGMVRVRPGGSSGTHNGMRSIIYLLGRDDFPRVRIGIGPPPDGYDMADWVVSHYPDAAARKVAFDSYMGAAQAVLTVIEDGVEAGMRLYNTKKVQFEVEKDMTAGPESPPAG